MTLSFLGDTGEHITCRTWLCLCWEKLSFYSVSPLGFFLLWVLLIRLFYLYLYFSLQMTFSSFKGCQWVQQSPTVSASTLRAACGGMSRSSEIGTILWRGRQPQEGGSACQRPAFLKVAEPGLTSGLIRHRSWQRSDVSGRAATWDFLDISSSGLCENTQLQKAMNSFTSLETGCLAGF